MPIKKNYEKFRASQHKTNKLLPWNTKYYESEYFEKNFSSQETIKLLKTILKKINSDFYYFFNNMVQSNSLDLLQKKRNQMGLFAQYYPKIVLLYL